MASDASLSATADPSVEPLLSISKDGLMDYGFKWGPVEVTRTATVDRGSKGVWYCVTVTSERRTLEVYITPSGLFRVFENGKKLTPEGAV